MMICGFEAPCAAMAFGRIEAVVAPASVREAGAGEEAGEDDGAFARLAALVRSNERHLAELEALNASLAEARAYLAGPSANVLLGRAQLDRVRTRRARVLAVLRSNRLAAREFLVP